MPETFKKLPAIGEKTPKTTPKREWLAPAWEPGQSGNPNGRPKGSRNKLGEAFWEALHDDFKYNGTAAIVKVRTDRPHEYLKVIAQVVPKELLVKDLSLEEMDDDALIEFLADIRAAKTALGRATARNGDSEQGGEAKAREPLN